MASVTINGHTYTDDANPTTGLGGGGHRARFIPLISDVVTILGTVAASGSITINRALVSNGSGQVAASSVTSTELGYLSGVTSAVQTQLDAKAPTDSPRFTGSVGIGVDAPARALHIASPGGFTEILITDPTAGTDRKTFGITSTNGTMQLRAFTDTYSAGYPRVCMTWSGEVLIFSDTNDATGARLQVHGDVNLRSGFTLKVNGVPVVGARQAAIANASVAYTTGTLDTEAEIITALNTTNGKINSILTALRTHGLIAT